jgi:glyoxylase-like metal-dependent hydrolase (beta-lactamase superfamily II)
MQIHSFFSGGYAGVCYLVTDDGGENAVLIDPAAPYALVTAKYGVLPYIHAILLTHGHFDHVLYLDEWREKTGAPVMIHREDAPMLGDPSLSCYQQFLGENTVHAPAEKLLSDGERIFFGEDSLCVMHTPGHTPGSSVYVGDGVMLTGDTLFANGGYGRFDLPGGSGKTLAESLGTLFSLPKNYRIYPGHGGPSDLYREKDFHF